MYLAICIFIAIILGYLFLITGPLVGGLLTFGLVVGLLFRVVYLLNQINQKLTDIDHMKTKVQKVYEEYMKERNTREN
ncbi:hypothetical protein [Bacillus kexueae]|uniref:hypothetical protein n=1 Tax=Aeribacillus kexueae TaxID=2078952 RepID=UPI001FAFBA92|nr:hypothetical protein [Bacillus kexueae]